MRERDLLVGFGQHIQALRKRAKLTQAEFGKQIGLGSQAVSNLERGLSFTDLGTLFRMSQVLKISLGALFSWAPKQGLPREIARQEELADRVRELLTSDQPVTAEEIADLVKGLAEKPRKR